MKPEWNRTMTKAVSSLAAFLLAVSTACAPTAFRADRGIGGTGAANFADRGIGGTGATAVFGAITAFGSVFVNGFEIENSRLREIEMDGQPAPIAVLRRGQVARVIARWDAGGLEADSIAVEHAVIGPVEHVAPNVIVVAGQTVRLLPGAEGALVAVGERVAVSGFRAANGDIRASRIDRAAGADTMVTGEPVRTGPGWQIGALQIVASDSADWTGRRVRLRGRLVAVAAGVSRLVVEQVSAAPLLTLRVGLDHAVVQAIGLASGERIRLGDGIDARNGAAIGTLPQSRPVILSLQLQADGGLTATGVVDSGGGDNGQSGAQSGSVGVSTATSSGSSQASGSTSGTGRGDDISGSNGSGSGGGSGSSGGGSSGGGSGGSGGGSGGGGNGGGGSGGGGGGSGGSGGGSGGGGSGGGGRK